MHEHTLSLTAFTSCTIPSSTSAASFGTATGERCLLLESSLNETPLQHGDVDLGHSDAVPCLKFLKCGNSACTSLGPAASFTGPRAWSCKLPNKPLQPQTLKQKPANGRSSDAIRSLRINMRRLINVSNDVPSKTIATKSHQANTPNNIPTSHTKTIIQNSREGSYETRRELFYLFPRREFLYVCGK